jgi:hypothetical protein
LETIVYTTRIEKFRSALVAAESQKSLEVGLSPDMKLGIIQAI